MPQTSSTGGVHRSGAATRHPARHSGHIYDAALLASIEAEIIQLEAEKRELLALQSQLREDEQRMMSQHNTSL